MENNRNNRFVIFTGFWTEGPALLMLPGTEPGDFVVCADGGYNICAQAGIKPEAVIGDFDSLSADQKAEIEALGIETVVYRSEKDETDTMLCAEYGLARGFGSFLIVGGIGGDFGHTMANLQVLSYLKDMKCEAELVAGKERLLMAVGAPAPACCETGPPVPVMLRGRPGARFSVFSYAERSSGVCIKNARYELTDAVLTHSNPVGVSNEFVNPEPVSVSVRHGRLLIVADRYEKK